MFAGAMGALTVMTILSAALGWAAPNLVRLGCLHGERRLRRWCMGCLAVPDASVPETG